MRCHICDAVLKEPVFNNDHQDYEPCPTCLIVIDETVGAFGIKPAADEDAFGEDPYDTYLPGLFDREDEHY